MTLRGGRRCFDCKTELALDLLAGLDPTRPELASLLRRFGALWLDTLIFNGAGTLLMLAVSVPLGILGVLSGERGSGVVGLLFGVFVYGGFAALMLLMVVYEALMVRQSGQTLGKKAAGIKVVSAEGGPVSAGQAWGRAVTRLILNCGCAFVDILPALFTRERTAIHDLLPRTRVVRVR